MSDRGLLIAGVVLLACCCCCANRNQQTDPPPQSQQAISAFAFAPETVSARANANAYTERLASDLRREVPSLVLLGTGVQDSCAPGQCRLAVDYFFGTDGDLLPALERVDAVLKRDSSSVPMGIETVRTGPTACGELRYVLRRPTGTTTTTNFQSSGWTARVFWIEMAAAAPDCPGRSERPTPDSPVYRVRDEHVEVGGLLAGVLGKHRFIVQIGITGSYSEGNS